MAIGQVGKDPYQASGAGKSEGAEGKKEQKEASVSEEIAKMIAKMQKGGKGGGGEQGGGGPPGGMDEAG